ncbi:four-carbon acid sugar kinase family protein [Lederbergia ruris]|uniref:four-carbon acid sugar kinase family protein n=1 Tax=Lederbergia ruris TaxID=217495 RepID=UPI0039A1952A
MIGVIADDITGSNDIGVMFSKSNYIADIYTYGPTVLSNVKKDDRDVLIFDTDSRLDDVKTAYDKVYQATLDIQKAGADQFFNKTCSVFRGNIGAEFDAMLDALKEEFAIVVLGFPKNGRTTVDSIHYVDGDKLQDSQFKDDPIHPMKESNLVTILQSQTKRKVGAIHRQMIKQGSKAIRQQVEQMKAGKQFQYVILDVTDQKDLYEIAQAVHREKVICGSSALAEEIPKVRAEHKVEVDSLPLPAKENGKGLFCSAGSLMPQTYRQINYMKQPGNLVLEFDTLAFIKSEEKNRYTHKLLEEIVKNINNGRNVILHSSNTQMKVRATKDEAAKRGWNNTETSKMISETIAYITSEVIRQTKQYRFVIAGGDTSATVCRALGIEGMRVWKEIQPGLPSCLSHTNPPYLFVLKSGSFGNATFIEEAFEHLLQW